MINKAIENNIRNLFSEKKYDELIEVIEKISNFEDRVPGMSSLLGICRISKINRSKQDLILGLKDFINAFEKSNDKNLTIEVLCNFISCSLNNHQKELNLLEYLSIAKNMFRKTEKKFGYHEKLFIHGVDLYNFFCDHEKLRLILKSLLINGTKSKSILCTYSFFNNYLYHWGKKDYYDYSLKFKNFFPTLETKKLNEIDFDSNKKIKIGFISCDFINHSVSYNTKPLLENLDKTKFETYGIYLGKSKDINNPASDITNVFDKWLNLSNHSNQQIINIIQNEKIEILIDQMGLTQASRIEIFNNRISPIQISWNAFCNTVGFDTIDYILVDNNLIYDDEQQFYSEKILRLKNIWNCHSGFNFERKKPTLPYKKNNFITFGSFNNFLKISDEVVDVWSTILNKLKNSQLILKSSYKYDSSSILRKFEKKGVTDSIKILDRANYPDIKDHLNLYNSIDISLDTFPYNGVTTSFESLWSGVPVMSLRGFNFNSRCGESILINGDLNFFLATNKDEYIKKCILLSENIEKLELEREKLFKNILNTPLFDAKQFANDFKETLLSVYKKN